MKKSFKLLIALLTLALVFSVGAVVISANASSQEGEYTLNGKTVSGIVSGSYYAHPDDASKTTFVAVVGDDGYRVSYPLSADGKTLVNTPCYYAIDDKAYRLVETWKIATPALSDGVVQKDEKENIILNSERTSFDVVVTSFTNGTESGNKLIENPRVELNSGKHLYNPFYGTFLDWKGDVIESKNTKDYTLRQFGVNKKATVTLLSDFVFEDTITYGSYANYLDLNGFNYLTLKSTYQEDNTGTSFRVFNATTQLHVYSSRPNGKMFVSSYSSVGASAYATFSISGGCRVFLGKVTDANGVTHSADNLSIYTNNLFRVISFDATAGDPSIVIDGGAYYNTQGGGRTALFEMTDAYSWLTEFDPVTGEQCVSYSKNPDGSTFTLDLKNATFYLTHGRSLFYSSGDYDYPAGLTPLDYVINMDNCVVAGTNGTKLFASMKYGGKYVPGSVEYDSDNNVISGVEVGKAIANISNSDILVDIGQTFKDMNIKQGCRLVSPTVLAAGIETAKTNETVTVKLNANTFSYEPLVLGEGEKPAVGVTPVTIKLSSFDTPETTQTFNFSTVTVASGEYTVIKWRDLYGNTKVENWKNGTIPVPPSEIIKDISEKSNDLCTYGFGDIKRADGTAKLYTVRQNLNFAVKMNLSLASNFVYNIYVPSNVDIGTVYKEEDYTKSEINDKKYVTINQEGYYQYSIPITASAAANEYLVHLTLPNTKGGVVDAENPTFNYTMKISVPAYAYQILNLGYGEKTNELMLAALMYVKCACDNFETVSQNVYYDKTVEILGSRVLETVEGTPMQEISPAVKEFVTGVVPGFDKELMYSFVINEAYTTLTSPAPTVSYYEYGKQKTYTVTEADVAQGYFIITFKAMDILSDVVVSYNGDTFTYNFGNHIYNKNNSATSTQAYKNLLYSVNAYSIAAKDYLASHDETPKIDVSINNNKLDSYSVVYDTESAKTAANTFAELLNEEYGLTLTPVAAADGNKIIFKKVAPDSYFDCKITVSGNDLVIECAYDTFFNTAAFNFAMEHFIDLNMSVNLPDGFEKNYYYGKILYSEFGVVGNGVADDFEAIRQAHTVANSKGYPVYGEEGKTYLIRHTYGNTILVKTDTDWCGANFIIDDTFLGEDSNLSATNLTFSGNDKSEAQTPIFTIDDDYGSFNLPALVELLNSAENKSANGGFAIDKDTIKKLNTGLGYDVLLLVKNNNEEHYIRYGYSTNNNKQQQQELVYVHADGTIDPSTPFLFDFSDVTSITAYRADSAPITVGNASFLTKACKVNFGTSYINIGGRSILITRPNTTLENVTHNIDDEYIYAEVGATSGEEMKRYSYTAEKIPGTNTQNPCWYKYSGSTYSGFFSVDKVTNVSLVGCNPTARTTSREGTYDISLSYANNITFESCIQSNFFEKDTTNPNMNYCWGVMGSNFCKNLSYINCELTRFDAHCGVYNAKIIGGKISLIRLTGGGEFLMQDVEIYRRWIGSEFVQLREDYGATWNGTVTIKDCTYNCYEGNASVMSVVSAPWAYHSFGGPNYKTVLPDVVIDNLMLGDYTEQIQEIVVYKFSNKSSDCKLTPPESDAYKEENPDNFDEDTETRFHLESFVGTDGATVPNLNPYTPAKYAIVKNNNTGCKYILTNDDASYYGTGKFLDSAKFDFKNNIIVIDPDIPEDYVPDGNDSPVLEYIPWIE